ncbi:MAG: methionine synthase [Pseudonocardiales bacterium]|nr:MAG: methionine synthase [Pseudonocardiales bacterium]
MTDRSWPAGASTGVGSLPGDDFADALRRVLEACPDLPFLPELPCRGPGAGLIGRGAALLAGLAVDLQPSGWRLVDRPGRDLHRARDLLARDLDALQEAAGDYSGPLKVQAAGPWTLAAGLELNRGDKSLADPGARRDVGAALAQGVGDHVAEVRRRVPGAEVLLQLDEPSLPVVLAGRVPTASGFDVLRPIEEHEAEFALHEILVAAGVPGLVHCCAPRAPIALLLRAGARALSLDMAMLSTKDDDELGPAVEGGAGLLLGLVPGIDAPLSAPAATVAPVRALWQRLGFLADDLATTVAVTPSCGLAGASPAYAWAALARCREAAQELAGA